MLNINLVGDTHFKYRLNSQLNNSYLFAKNIVDGCTILSNVQEDLNIQIRTILT